MLFCSQAYLVFFTLLFAVYWALPWPRARIWLLLAASFYFYACWNRWLALLIGVSTCVDYGLARGMDALTGPRCLARCRYAVQRTVPQVANAKQAGASPAR